MNGTTKWLALMAVVVGASVAGTWALARGHESIAVNAAEIRGIQSELSQLRKDMNRRFDRLDGWLQPSP